MTLDLRMLKGARKQAGKAAGSERIPPIAGMLFTVVMILAAGSALGLDKLQVADWAIGLTVVIWGLIGTYILNAVKVAYSSI